jgi:phage tail-like protein
MADFGSRGWMRKWPAVVVLVLVAASGARAQTTQSFTFRVEIDGASTGFFKSVSGMDVETEVIEYREGGLNDRIYKMPGVRKWPNLVLKQEFTGDPSLYNWFMSGVRVNGRITMIDLRGVEVAAWEFKNGFPAKWKGPEFDASTNDVAMETIEIAHDGLVMSPRR